MKFFTKELWLETQSIPPSKEAHSKWQKALDEYRIQLAELRSRLPPEVYEFFWEVNLHDGELLDLVILDGSRPAPLTEPVRRWDHSTNYPVRIEMTILDAYDEYVWRLSYANVRRLVIDFPSDRAVRYREGEGFGDWGYDELTGAGNGFLRHEILFATGSSLLFEFKGIAINRRPRPQVGEAKH